MQPATVHLLTAFHALTHRLSLTEDFKAELERQGASLSPELWRVTVGLLHEADRGAPGTRVDIGFEPLLHRWLGVDDERGFVESYGIGAADALDCDRGVLGPLAEAIANGNGPEAVRDLVSHAWAARAVRLMDALPKTAGAVVEALDRAIEGCPWPPPRRRALFEAMAVASEALGDWGRAEAARQWIHRLDQEDAFAYIAAQTLFILWCVTHDELLLSHERGRDPGIDPSPAGWARVREAVEAGRHEDVPAPVGTFAAWSSGDGLEEYAIRIALQTHASLLADMARAIELLLKRGGEPVSLAFDAWRLGVDALARRRDRIEGGFQPLPGERRNLFCEAHQGARRPETMERVAVLRRLHETLEPCEKAEPLAAARVHVARAAECTARGEHEEAWPLLVKASELADEIPHDPDRQGGTKAWLAEYRWRAGARSARPDACCRSFAVRGRPSFFGGLRRGSPSARPWAKRSGPFAGAGTSSRGASLAHAHLAAGHAIAAERMACELCRTASARAPRVDDARAGARGRQPVPRRGRAGPRGPCPGGRRRTRPGVARPDPEPPGAGWPRGEHGARGRGDRGPSGRGAGRKSRPGRGGADRARRRGRHQRSAGAGTTKCGRFGRPTSRPRSGWGRRLRAAATACGRRTRPSGSRASPRPRPTSPRRWRASSSSGSRPSSTSASSSPGRSSAPSKDSTPRRLRTHRPASFSRTATGARSRKRAPRPPRGPQSRSASASRLRTPTGRPCPSLAAAPPRDRHRARDGARGASSCERARPSRLLRRGRRR